MCSFLVTLVPLPPQILLVLFWLLFAIIGMHVFGGIDLLTTIYPNYDTFLGSMVSTFNVSQSTHER